MKILLLNPHIDALHDIVQVLKNRGMAVLLPANAEEALQVLKLHAASVDLAIIHREGVKSGDPGVELLYKIKRDPAQADLPVLFTTDSWDADQCANHQQTAIGANAYLRWPFDGEELVKTIDAIFGQESVAPTVEPPSSAEFVLETPSLSSGAQSSGSSSFQLEPPSVEIEELKVEISNTNPELEPAVEAPSEPDSVPVPVDAEAAKEMPYLFSPPPTSSAYSEAAFAQPVGDAVVPGGAVRSPDTETLKKYLLLREQDVAALSVQLRAAREELAALKEQHAAERAHAEELQFTVQDQKRKIEDFEREKVLALEGVQAEINELRFQNKAKSDKAKNLETQVREASDEIERLKERVRCDIRKIRVRERELENKLEIAKKDSEAILTARENKIIELKRKLDLLEFNMDLLQDRYSREKEASAKLREKLAKAAQVVRVAEGLLDEPAPALKASSEPGDTKAS